MLFVKHGKKTTITTKQTKNLVSIPPSKDGIGTNAKTAKKTSKLPSI